jgi:hypothetical protein
MRNPAFSPLNGGHLNLESAKQTKYRVASLLKILRNCPFAGSGRRKDRKAGISVGFAANSAGYG